MFANAGPRLPFQPPRWFKAITCAGSQSVVTFSDIPQSYTHMEIIFSGQGSAATSVYMKCNQDGTAGNYLNSEEVYGVGTGNASALLNAATSNGALIIAIPVSSVTNALVCQRILIPLYCGTYLQKGIISHAGLTYQTGASPNQAQAWAAQWLSLAPISRIDFTIGSGNFVNGSTFSIELFGYKGV